MSSSSSLPFRFRALELFQALLGLLSPLGIQGSSGDLYHGAVFGRDSLRVGLDLTPWLCPLSETIIFSLASLQATAANPVADAKGPGQISHEARFLFMGSRKVGPRQRALLEEFAARWGGTSTQVIQYGSADATPQFVRLVAAHCRLYGTTLLDAEFRHIHGHILTLRESVRAAVQWTEDQIVVADPPLLGFQRTNTEYGHRWQVLQDGATSVIHPNGHLANADARVETIGLQGLAYDALVEGAALLEATIPAEASRWRALADRLQRATMEAFWMPEEEYFGMAIDRDPADGMTRRLVRTLSAMPTELLETRIFDTLPEAERARYIAGIVRVAHGPELMTTAGIRSRAVCHADLLPYWDYHGVQTCWGVTNSMYAQGLDRQGFPELARDVKYKHVDALRIAGALDEFLYVDVDGRVRYALADRTPESPEMDVIYGTNLPEPDQGWTVSFVLRVLLEREEPLPSPTMPITWQPPLVREIAAQIPLTTRLLTDAEVSQARDVDMRISYVDKLETQRLEREVVARGYGKLPSATQPGVGTAREVRE